MKKPIIAGMIIAHNPPHRKLAAKVVALVRTSGQPTAAGDICRSRVR